MKPISIAAITAAMLLASAGCKKDSVDPPATTPPNSITATVRMNYMFVNGTEPFVLNNTVLRDTNGVAVKLDAVRFFVSGVHAMDDADNAIGHYESAYMLVDASQATNDFLLGQIHASHIHQFHFDLGLDATANSGDPATAAAPLNDASMFFAGQWTGMGYKFFAVSGFADVDNNGTYETPVRYECGMNTALTEAHAHVDHELANGDTYTAQINVDLNRIFAGLNLTTWPTPDMHSPECARIMLDLSAGIDGME
ncbi:MAG: MbnP family protein [Flavobacteriales bacterium]